MKAFQNILLFTIVLFLIGCSADDEKINQIEECSKIDKSKILSEEELKTACITIAVYRYKSELFLQCKCCLCLKFDIPKNCEGNPVCESYQNCREDFLLNAEYLFSMIDE